MSNPTNFSPRTKSAKDRLVPPRRSFLKFGGTTLAGTALLFSGCEYLDDVIPREPAPDQVNLGSGDIGILNFAYTLEQLESAFYTRVVANYFYPGASTEEMRVLNDLREREVAHREFYEAALGEKAIPHLEFDFSSVDFNDKESVLRTAQTFENLGVAAYNGAGPLLKNPDYLAVAGKIVSVEARHAEVILDLINPGGAFVDFVEDGLDRAFLPPKVLEAASPFIVTKIDASHLPTT